MSLDDKRAAMLEIFHESRDVFMLKDIEKLSVKKGIIQQAVKDVLQSLVDDDLVRQEKIGISNYYWSFPSEASVKMESDLKKLQEAVRAAKLRKVELAAAVEVEKSGKEVSETRTLKVKQLEAIQTEINACDEELFKYKDNDPKRYEAMLKAVKVAKSAANRWTDNIDCLMSWAKKRFEGHAEEIKNLFKENGALDLEPI
ncbi:hypothetical protein CEUSTIGMA_g10207.t1 [Chlamydomonas eustigma]|uniref:Meiotic nuclear division protein 1 homolog n=1 Tax=Chlamydomonas eustigma TaxID=1157962 RepID=A0A250XI76_9CHLO|nr:hypothetical protein CEUSTIGMA_g10207.t1 [Chlamydomonas eustigma]|eukprot:GAX82781.1 hypothetical protein CEUSTIGMA_g10207.t1 [Chlamydomonas eustigma]